jgi:hypothetical protein
VSRISLRARSQKPELMSSWSSGSTGADDAMDLTNGPSPEAGAPCRRSKQALEKALMTCA